MKLVKMSLAAAMVLSTAAMAEITNLKVGGDAKLYYSTNDEGTNSFFDKASSAADVAFSIHATADLAKNISAGVKTIHLTTLGLENELVSNTWSGAHPVETGNNASFLRTQYTGAQVEDITFTSEAWIALTAGKTIAKIGRQPLDTPLAFTETWSVDENTFGAAVLINQNVENLTLVGAWVGTDNNGNGTTLPAPVNGNLGHAGGITQSGADFDTFGVDGAFALGAVYGIEDLTAQLWMYDLMSYASATWLQVDYGMGALSLGLQYTTLEGKASTKNTTVGTDTSGIDTNAMALKVGFKASDALTVSAAYSAVDKNANAGYNTSGSGQSKLYTESWWTFGKVTQADTTTMNVTAEYALDKTMKVGFYATMADQVTTAATGTTAASGNNDLTEYTLTLSKDYENFNATVAYISTDTTKYVAGTTNDFVTTAQSELQVLLSASF